jgi:serine/threonine protein kinase
MRVPLREDSIGTVAAGSGTAQPCPEPHELAPLVDGTIDADARARLAEHLASCASCRRACSELVRGRGRGTDDAAAEGDRIGRYVLGAPLGAGAMGVVFRAHDPLLRRDVAVKVIDGHGLDTAAREQLLREARAMAGVSSPYVVACYDAGFSDGDVFVAMELIEGETLRAWAERRAGWQRIAQLGMEAARGLAAAHATDLVHRDVKPDNILVRARGGAAVGDFGLARGDGGGGAAVAPSMARGTRAAGTPRYLAPEVRRGEGATAASDQYALCLTLVEVLTGDTRTDAAALAELPRALRQVLVRGLADDPHARWPSLQVMANELERVVRPRRGWMWIGGGVAAAVAAAWLAWPRTVADPCAAGPEVTAWPALLRMRIQTLLDDERWERVERITGEQRTGAAATWAGACAKPPSSPVRACLDAASRDLALVGRALASERATAVYVADHLHDYLAVEVCRAAAPAVPSAPVDPTVHLAFVRADVRSAVGDHAGALALLRSLDVASPVVAARRDVMLASEAGVVGDDVTLREAEARIRALPDDGVRTRALLALARARWFAHGDSIATRTLVDEVTPRIGRAGDPRLDYELAYVQSLLALDAVDIPAASAAAQRAFELARTVFGEARPELAAVLVVRGQIASLASDLDGAARDYQHAIALLTAAHGARSPEVINVRMSLATNELFAHRPERGKAEYRAILDTLGLDAEPTLRAEALSGWCEALYESGDPAVQPACREALAAGERAYGPDHPRLGVALIDLGQALLASDDDSQLPEAIQLLRRAVVLASRLSDDERAVASFLLARSLVANHEAPDEVRGLLEFAIPVLRKSPQRAGLVELIPRWYPEWRALAAYRGATGGKP